jgi:hypothetical protein
MVIYAKNLRAIIHVYFYNVHPDRNTFVHVAVDWIICDEEYFLREKLKLDQWI